jgi:hypothetical protein
MSDVLFTHSYFLRFDPKEFRAMMPYPPLGTLYAASSVRSRGYSVGLFDSMLAVNEQELRAVMRRLQLPHKNVSDTDARCRLPDVVTRQE